MSPPVKLNRSCESSGSPSSSSMSYWLSWGVPGAKNKRITRARLITGTNFRITSQPDLSMSWRRRMLADRLTESTKTIVIPRNIAVTMSLESGRKSLGIAGIVMAWMTPTNTITKRLSLRNSRRLSLPLKVNRSRSIRGVGLIGLFDDIWLPENRPNDRDFKAYGMREYTYCVYSLWSEAGMGGGCGFWCFTFGRLYPDGGDSR